MIHAKLCLPQDHLLAHWLGLACGAYYIASLCSALAVTLDKKEACFLWPRRVVEHGKILIMMVNSIMLQYFYLCMMNNCIYIYIYIYIYVAVPDRIQILC